MIKHSDINILLNLPVQVMIKQSTIDLRLNHPALAMVKYTTIDILFSHPALSGAELFSSVWTTHYKSWSSTALLTSGWTTLYKSLSGTEQLASGAQHYWHLIESSCTFSPRRMSYQDFSSNFQKLEICNLGPDEHTAEDDEGEERKRWAVTSENGAWTSRVSAGGCRNYLGKLYHIILSCPHKLQCLPITHSPI